MSYYSNVNPDLLEKIPMNAARILEIGSGEGRFAAAVKARNPDVVYFGVELFDDAATKASSHIDHVLHGNIEEPQTFAALQSLQAGDPFDVLFFGEVLEHLLDPWAVLAKLRTLMGKDSVCVICISNVSHWSLIQQQMKGRWDYRDSGLLDRTHVRFFTKDTACEMLTAAGWTVLDTAPRILFEQKTKDALKALQPVASVWGLDQTKFNRDLSAFQWVIRAVNGAPKPITSIAALTIRKVAGVNEARVDNPLKALNTTVTSRAVWGEGSLSIPADFDAGVLILHRQFVNSRAIADHVERLIAKGWIVVSDMDDDPHHWRGYVESDFIAFRGVHAVTVSTEPMAAMMRQWNPNVAIFRNAIFEIPQLPPKPSYASAKKRLFFGALNRTADWNKIKDGVISALLQMKDKVQFFIVHDQAIFDSLPSEIDKEFHTTLPPSRYLEVLGSCDVALLPLSDTPFNRLKSDIKLMECCAVGTVPIFSPIVYADDPKTGPLGLCVHNEDGWGPAIQHLIDHPDVLENFRAKGQAYVKAERMHSHLLGPRADWLASLKDNRAELERARLDRLGALGKKAL
jgi:2-polyprenyl-3-methyl-5-hydroxy-6-metoxy-1,4-benzoquinol methylase